MVTFKKMLCFQCTTITVTACTKEQQTRKSEAELWVLAEISTGWGGIKKGTDTLFYDAAALDGARVVYVKKEP